MTKRECSYQNNYVFDPHSEDDDRKCSLRLSVHPILPTMKQYKHRSEDEKPVRGQTVNPSTAIVEPIFFVTGTLLGFFRCHIGITGWDHQIKETNSVLGIGKLSIRLGYMPPMASRGVPKPKSSDVGIPTVSQLERSGRGRRWSSCPPPQQDMGFAEL